jgi:hypothetical protein
VEGHACVEIHIGIKGIVIIPTIEFIRESPDPGGIVIIIGVIIVIIVDDNLLTTVFVNIFILVDCLTFLRFITCL